MRRMYDAAYPPASPPPWDAVAFYIGGNTPHVWTAAEIAAQPARWRLPIYVRSNPAGHDPRADAAEALVRLQRLGAPHGSAVALDLETAVHTQYVRAFDATVTAAGYVVLAYGSLSTVFANPRTSGGYWVAHYTGAPHMARGAVATQYADDKLLRAPYDASLIDEAVPLWDTQQTQEDDMAEVTSLGGGVAQTVPAKGDISVKLTKEYSDSHGHHGDNGYSVIVTDKRWADAKAFVDVTGLRAGDKVEVSWSRMTAPAKDGDPWVVDEDVWRIPFRAGDGGAQRFQLAGSLGLDADHRLRLRVYNPNDYPISMTYARVVVTLMKY